MPTIYHLIEKIDSLYPKFNLIKFSTLDSKTKLEIIDKINTFFKDAIYNHNKFKYVNDYSKNEFLQLKENADYFDYQKVDAFRFKFKNVNHTQENIPLENTSGIQDENLDYSQYFEIYENKLVLKDFENLTDKLKNKIQLKDRTSTLSPFNNNPPMDVSIDDFCDNVDNIDYSHSQEIDVEYAYLTKDIIGELKNDSE